MVASMLIMKVLCYLHMLILLFIMFYALYSLGNSTNYIITQECFSFPIIVVIVMHYDIQWQLPWQTKLCICRNLNLSKMLCLKCLNSSKKKQMEFSHATNSISDMAKRGFPVTWLGDSPDMYGIPWHRGIPGGQTLRRSVPLKIRLYL